MANALAPDLLEKMHAYWRAANYLSVGQIYLRDNPLLEAPLERRHLKPRLLGHWGTTAGLNFLYVHLNRLIKENDLNMIYIIGPGHGGPGLVAHTYLEGSYSERYPNIERNREGLRRLFRQFSWPYGVPSHVAPETPGSIHEGGELGYSLAHAYGAAFDNPELIVACIIGDGEAETGALAASWHSNKFLNPARDGAVLPILHLNGFKIANPTVLARISREELTALLRGYGYDPLFVEGEEPAAVHQALAATLDRVLAEIRRIQNEARGTRHVKRARWPMVVFRTPKGWTGPKFVDGKPVEGTWRAHQVPISDFEKPEHLAALEAWLESYRSSTHGRQSPCQRRRAAAAAVAAAVSRLRRQAGGAGSGRRGSDADPRQIFARRVQAQCPQTQLPPIRPGRDRIEPARCRLCRRREGMDGRDRGCRRRSQPRRPRPRSPERAPLPGLARGLSAHGAPRPVLLLRGVHPHRGFHGQPACQMAEDDARHPVAKADRFAQLSVDLARLAPGPQRLLPSGSRLHRPSRQQESRNRAHLSSARCQLPALGRRSLPAQPRLHQCDRCRKAARMAVARHRCGGAPLRARGGRVGMGEQRRRRARRGHGLRRRCAHARDAGGRHAAARLCSGHPHPRRQRRRPDGTRAAEQTSAWNGGPRFRRAVHPRSTGDLRLSRLPHHDPQTDLSPEEPRQHPRARLSRGGDHDHAVRHGGAQQSRPLSACARCDPPDSAAGGRGREGDGALLDQDGTPQALRQRARRGHAGGAELEMGSVGWVKRSATHHYGHLVGFAALNPPYSLDPHYIPSMYPPHVAPLRLFRTGAVGGLHSSG